MLLTGYGLDETRCDTSYSFSINGCGRDSADTGGERRAMTAHQAAAGEIHRAYASHEKPDYISLGDRIINFRTIKSSHVYIKQHYRV